MTDIMAKAVGIEIDSAASHTHAALRTAGIAIAGSIFVAICAHLTVPLLFTPVPLTMQTFAVLLLALVLGPGTAFSALALYLAEGAAGLPVFAPGGLGGIAQLLGPTGGYLLSYPFVAALVSWLARKAAPTFLTRAWSAAAGSILLLLCGGAWLAVLTQAKPKTVMDTAILPFLPGDTLKMFAAAALATAWQRARKSTPSASSN